MLAAPSTSPQEPYPRSLSRTLSRVIRFKVVVPALRRALKLPASPLGWAVRVTLTFAATAAVIVGGWALARADLDAEPPGVTGVPPGLAEPGVYSKLYPLSDGTLLLEVSVDADAAQTKAGGGGDHDVSGIVVGALGVAGATLTFSTAYLSFKAGRDKTADTSATPMPVGG